MQPYHFSEPEHYLPLDSLAVLVRYWRLERYNIELPDDMVVLVAGGLGFVQTLTVKAVAWPFRAQMM